MDEYLGNNDKIFSILGTNVDYGPVSIIFDKSVMDENYEMIINSSTTFLSKVSYQLRPWMHKELEKNDIIYSCISDNLNHFRIHKTSSLRSGSIATMSEWCLLKQVWQRSKLNAKCENWKEIFTKEITGQAKCNIANDSLLVKYDLKSYLKKPMRTIIDEDIINWYLSVDSHSKIEGLLPSEVSLDKIKFLIIPEKHLNSELKKLLKGISTDIYGGTMSDRVIVTKNEKETELWQNIYFLFGDPTFGKFEIPKDFVFTLRTLELLEYWMEKSNNFGSRDNVIKIDISSNSLEVFPDMIMKYQKLYALNISHNQFLTIPSFLAYLPSFELLQGLETNPLPLIPREVVLSGWKSVKEFIKVQNHSVTWNKVKLVFVGKEGSGKTSAVSRLRKIKYNDNVSTNGIEVSSITSQNGIEFEFFDLGGQLIFCKNFYYIILFYLFIIFIIFILSLFYFILFYLYFIIFYVFFYVFLFVLFYFIYFLFHFIL